MPRLTDITIVVATRDEARNIGAFLHSVPADMALVVVDNSTDETPAIVAALRPERTKVLRFDGSLTAARQFGALHPETEWLLFTDADIAFHASYFDRLAMVSGCASAYGPKLSQDTYRRYYAWFARGQAALHALGVPAASGSNLLVSKRAFMDVGGFDLELPCNEDSELAWRLHRRGHRCLFDDRLIVWATDHRRLERGVIAKTAHSIARCALLFTGLMPRRWRNHDWGYWSSSKAARAGQIE